MRIPNAVGLKVTVKVVGCTGSQGLDQRRGDDEVRGISSIERERDEVQVDRTGVLDGERLGSCQGVDFKFAKVRNGASINVGMPWIMDGQSGERVSRRWYMSVKLLPLAGASLGTLVGRIDG